MAVSGQWTITRSPCSSCILKESYKAYMIHASRNQGPWNWGGETEDMGRREIIDMAVGGESPMTQV